MQDTQLQQDTDCQKGVPINVLSNIVNTYNNKFQRQEEVF